MYIKSLELNNYRNYDNLSIEFERGTNILYGNNAQGKTNILESIYVASTTKSHRGSKDREIINFEKDEAHIKATVMKKDVPIRIDIHLKKNKSKGIAINGIPIRKASELFGVLNVVFFSPEDLNIIKNGPAERRRFIDLELCQLDKIYVHNLVNYNKIVNQRNKLLRDLGFNYDKELVSTLDIWDMQLADYGAKIITRRNQFIDEINEIIYGIHRNITNGKEELIVRYEPNITGNNIYEELVRSRDKDLKLKTTSVGPHRDDISFLNKKIDIRKFGSQGQQRTAALSLKLSEIELVKSIIKDTPILLLDDVLSELDSNRQRHLLGNLYNVQTIITCTGLDEFVENRFNIDNIYKVVEGTVERSQNGRQ
ncbi:MAG: DNA replication/repair protein RecF [Lachnospiraceae bacterium]|nr:DNA replication/repair protein RecF [Lachnospiraceae bacterium]MEE0863344.1 DNA replication/repair protein RecF [Lachnospiraceae bacterium]